MVVVSLEAGKKLICHYVGEGDEYPGRQAEDAVGYELGDRVREAFNGQHEHKGDPDPNHSAVDDGTYFFSHFLLLPKKR